METELGKEKSRFAELSRDKLFFGIVCGLILLFASIPWIYGYLSTPKGKWFSGIVDNVHDTAQYLSWMKEAGHHFLSEDKLTSEPGNENFINLHWWLLGRLSSIFGISIFLTYDIFRVFSILFLIFISYKFLSIFFKGSERKFAFILCFATSGLGWIWVVLKQFTGDLLFPLDIHNTLGNGFYNGLTYPHLTFSAALVISVFYFYLKSNAKDRTKSSILLGLLILFLGLGHIYDLVTIWGVIGLFILIILIRDGFSWKRVLNFLILLAVSLPAVVYWGYISQDPLWKQALSQYKNLGVFSPDPLHLIILLGITFLVGIATYTGLVPLKKLSDEKLFNQVWFIIVPVLIYLPLQFQVMLLTGYQIPMTIMATIGLYEIIFPWIKQHTPERFTRKWRVNYGLILEGLFIVLIIPANLYLFSWRLLVLSRHTYPYYLNVDDLNAMIWLKENTNPNDVVLSSLSIGHYIPGVSGNKAFLSNAVMTLNYYEKDTAVNRVFDASIPNDQRQVILDSYQVDYIFYGDEERSLGSYDPSNSQFMKKVFSSSKTQIYQVIR